MTLPICQGCYSGSTTLRGDVSLKMKRPARPRAVTPRQDRRCSGSPTERRQVGTRGRDSKTTTLLTRMSGQVKPDPWSPSAVDPHTAFPKKPPGRAVLVQWGTGLGCNNPSCDNSAHKPVLSPRPSPPHPPVTTSPTTRPIPRPKESHVQTWEHLARGRYGRGPGSGPEAGQPT